MSYNTLRQRLEAHASNGREAYGLIEKWFAGAVAALRRDPRFSRVTITDFDLLLADVRDDAEDELFERLHDRVRLDDIGDSDDA